MPETVRAEVRYVNPEWRGRSEIPQIYSKELRYANTSVHQVEIQDARPLLERGELDLDRHGFTLVEHYSRAAGFGEEGEFGKDYLEEMEQLIRQVAGADETFMFNEATVRAANPKTFFGDGYALYFHTDYSDRLRASNERELLAKANSPLLDDASGWGFAWYNLWRPANGEVEQNPLALIDASSLDPHDLVPYGLDPDNKTVSMLPLFSSGQRVFYFSRMRNHEVLIFKQADSRQNTGKVCPHTSFRIPDAPDNARRRRSVEARFMCAFAPKD